MSDKNDENYVLSSEPDSENSDSASEAENMMPTEFQLDVPKPTISDFRNIEVSAFTGLPKKTFFCPYCHNFVSKFARHIEFVHKNEPAVKKLRSLPKNNAERKLLIDTIRKHGMFLHNTQACYNTGQLLVTRRPTIAQKRSSDDYLSCANCRTFITKNKLRAHYRKCTRKPRAGERGVKILSRQLVTKIHQVANDVLRYKVFPVLRDCEVVDMIRYDELAILFGNRQCLRYTLEHQYDMIRGHMRLIGRFKKELVQIQPQLTELSQIYHPRHYDDVIKTVNNCADFDEDTQMYRTPTVASSLLTIIQK